MFQTIDVLLDYLLVLLSSCFSHFFYYQFFVLFYFVVGPTYLFYLYAFNLSVPCSFVSLSFSSWEIPLVALFFIGMSCRRCFLPRPCPQFFNERDTLGRMMMIICLISPLFLNTYYITVIDCSNLFYILQLIRK